jgi:hypothetical protein
MILRDHNASKETNGLAHSATLFLNSFCILEFTGQTILLYRIVIRCIFLAGGSANQDGTALNSRKVMSPCDSGYLLWPTASFATADVRTKYFVFQKAAGFF